MAGARFTKGISGKEWRSYHVKKDDIYVYTFGAIKVLNEREGETKENISNGYDNIHNIYNYYDSYEPNGNQKGTNASSINAKFGHTELYKLQSKEVLLSCNSHLMSNYKEAIQNPEKSKLEIKCKATYPEISMNTSGMPAILQ